MHVTVARLGREDLSTLPAFERAYKSLRDDDDAGGALLAAAYAVQAIAAAYADFRDANTWVARLHEAQPAIATLDAQERLVVYAAIVSAAVIVDTTGFDAPEVAAALEQALQLLPGLQEARARNDVVAGARALLEYCEQQGQPDTFHRVVETAERCCASGPVSPLVLGRYLIYVARCRFRLGAYEREKTHAFGEGGPVHRNSQWHALLPAARGEWLHAADWTEHVRGDLLVGDVQCQMGVARQPRAGELSAAALPAQRLGDILRGFQFDNRYGDQELAERRSLLSARSPA